MDLKDELKSLGWDNDLINTFHKIAKKVEEDAVVGSNVEYITSENEIFSSKNINIDINQASEFELTKFNKC